MASGAVKVQVGVLMAVVVMMVATSVVTPVDARLDFSQILDSFDSYVSRENNGACCDKCICTRSFPPQCRCLDIKETCYEGCKGCLCTRSFPPQCRCTDIIQGFCYKPCTSTTTDN